MVNNTTRTHDMAQLYYAKLKNGKDEFIKLGVTDILHLKVKQFEAEGYEVQLQEVCNFKSKQDAITALKEFDKFNSSSRYIPDYTFSETDNCYHIEKVFSNVAPVHESIKEVQKDATKSEIERMLRAGYKQSEICKELDVKAYKVCRIKKRMR